jgi:hypothetical protein
MKLTGQNGTSFELVALRYEFPEDRGDYFAANWLMVRVGIETNGDYWQAEDAALLTFEIPSLAEWMEWVADERAPQPINLVEPYLEFERIAGGVSPVIRIYLGFGFRPPSHDRTRYSGAHDSFVDVRCAPEELRHAAKDLRRILERFPIRGEAVGSPWPGPYAGETSK